MSETIVLDASITISWLLSPEPVQQSEQVRRAIENGMKAVAPPNWHSRVMQACIDAEDSGQVRPSYTNRAFTLLDQLPIAIEQSYTPSHLSNWFRITRETHLDIDRASFIELALRKVLPLASINAAVIKAAEWMGVSLFQETQPVR